MIEHQVIRDRRLVARWGNVRELAHLNPSECRPDLVIYCNGVEVDEVIGVDQPNGVLWAWATGRKGQHYLTADDDGQVYPVRVKLEGCIEVKYK